MKNFLKSTIKNPIIIVFVFISVVFGFTALGRSSQVEEYSIVIGVGIDKSESAEFKYDVSLLTFVPIADQNFSETYNVVYSKGNSLASAIDSADLYLGREIRFAHIKTIVLGSELLKQGEDVSTLLDFLARENDVSASTRIVVSKGKAGEFMDMAKKLDSSSSTKISQIVSINKEELYSMESTLEKFYRDYFGETKVSLLPVFEVDDKVGINPSTQTQQSGGATQQSEKEKKLIVNTGTAFVLKDGKYAFEMGKEDLKNTNMLCANFKKGILKVEDFDGEQYKDVDMTFEIYGLKVKKKVEFENGIPVILMNLSIELVPSEINYKNGMVAKNSDIKRFGKKDCKQIENAIKKDISKALALVKEKKIDVANFYTLLYNGDRGKFKKYLQNFERKEDFLEGVVVKAKVNVRFR